MKTLITTLLAVALVALPVEAKQDKKPEAIGVQIFLGVLVLTVTATAAVVVIKICSNKNEDKGPVKVVLEKSEDHVNWTPVYTNTVVLNGQSPIEFFSEDQKPGSAFYRARKL